MKKKAWIAAGGCLILFVILVLLVKKADVAVISESTGKPVGLSALNRLFYKETPNMVWYYITEVLGWLTLLIAAAFAILGLSQLIRRKSLKKVDPSILKLGGLYVVLLLVYALFEKVVINYRPVLMEGEIEASFPSSHTMLAIVVLGSGMMLLPDYIEDKKMLRLLQAAGCVLLAVLVVGRLLSGAHWLTDILGGVLISAALLNAFAAVRKPLEK